MTQGQDPDDIILLGHEQPSTRLVHRRKCDIGHGIITKAERFGTVVSRDVSDGCIVCLR